MLKHFYSYHIEIESIIVEINALEIKPHEKKHLIELVESHVHHTVLDVVLSELEEDDKKTFLSHLNTRDQEKTWKFLRERIENVEEKIVNAANSIKSELLKDIREARV